MLVRDIMNRQVRIIPPDMSLSSAYGIMQSHSIRHLPVVDEGRLLGVVTDRDLRLATSALSPVPFPADARVQDVMAAPPRTADPMDPVEEAARTMRELKIGCLPVLDDDGGLVGIVTGIDLLDALVRLTGVDKPSGRIEVRLPDRPGELARLTSFLSHRNVNIHSILSYPEGPDTVTSVLRVGTIEIRPVADALRKADFEVLWPPPKPWAR
jgi:acetoin utilization protein AcuB